MENEYMKQVIQQRSEIERDLRNQHNWADKAAPARQRIWAAAADGGNHKKGINADDDEDGALAGSLVRITGFWRWQNVIVPPNVYVVHTRRGHEQPLHCGLGVSFRFDPVTDSFLVVPAAMQTIIISANCITQERQGVLVQGYVQWVIDDFQKAYRRLDFGDATDPMRVVNVQLREQAEAVIKDTVATMSLNTALSDRQPIIEELTSRLRKIAEGESEKEGLGLRIVTVQIKEAVVSSAKVWEMLQRPFRAEQAKQARLAELEQEALVEARESEAEKVAARLKITTQAEINRHQAEADAAAFDNKQAETLRRNRMEAEALQESLAFEKARQAADDELQLLRLEQELNLARRRFAANHEQAQQKLDLAAARRRVSNDLSANLLQQRLIDALPEIAAQLPKPQELRSIQFSGMDSLAPLLSELTDLLGRFRGHPSSNGSSST